MPSLLRYFRPKCAERCRRLVRRSDYPKLYLELLVFMLKIAQMLHKLACSVDQNIYHTDVW